MTTTASQIARVVTDRAAAVLLVDLEAGQVVYANELAAQLAPGVPLPVDVARWSDVAGLRDDSGADLESTATPLRRVAAGEPVTGEIVTAQRHSDASEARERLWVIGLPLTDAPFPLGRRALVVLLPVRADTTVEAVASAAGAGVVDDLRHRAVIASDLAFSISDPHAEDDPLVWVNPAFERVTGHRAEDVLGRNCRLLQGPLTDPEAIRRIGAGLRDGGVVSETLLNYRADGTAFWNHLVISPVFDSTGRLTHHVGVQSDVTERVDADAARDAALVLAREATARQRAVSAISQELESRIADPADLRNDIPVLVASHFEGWAAAITLDNGSVNEVAIAYGAPAGVPPGGADAGVRQRDPVQAEAAFRAFLAGPGSPLVAAASGRSGPTQWPVLMQLDADTVEGLTEAPSVPGLAAARASRSVLAAPMMARGRITGLLVVTRPGEDRFADGDEVAVLADIALRAGTALDNARLYARERDAALVLQRSLLPHVPELDSFDVAATYVAAAAAEVGGDWYDVVDLPGPWIGVAVGDVVGHDMRAAAAMGQLRSMLRTLAWSGLRPGQLVERLDELVRNTGTTPMATLLYAVIDDPVAHDGAARVTYTSAGHPPGLLRRADGTIERLEGARTSPVGVADPRPVPEAHAELCEGATLVLYTDGLIERPGEDIDTGIDRLAALMSAAPAGESAQRLCDRITAALIPGPSGASGAGDRPDEEHTDDTCVLVLTRPVTRPVTRPAAERDPVVP